MAVSVISFVVKVKVKAEAVFAVSSSSRAAVMPSVVVRRGTKLKSLVLA